VLQNPKDPGPCQWSQNFLLQETSGVGVTLTKFVAGGVDLSASLASYFGSTRLNPGGTLSGAVCWANLSPPVLLNYELYGTDDVGNPVSAALTAANLPAASSARSLSITPAAVNMSSSPMLIQVAPSSPTQVWSVTVFSSGAPVSWLALSALSGTGPATVVLTASQAGLSPDTYKATLVFQSLDALPQVVQVPVTFGVTGSP
jgi:hypothetical protein